MQMLFKYDLKWEHNRPLGAGNKLRAATGNREWIVNPASGEIEISKHEVASEHGFIGQLGVMQDLGIRGYIIIADSLCADLVKWDLLDEGVSQFGPLRYDLNFNMLERR